MYHYELLISTEDVNHKKRKIPYKNEMCITHVACSKHIQAHIHFIVIVAVNKVAIHFMTNAELRWMNGCINGAQTSLCDKFMH